MSRVPSTLARLCRQHGVQTAYVDVAGRRRSADPEALLAVLRALGLEIDSAARAESALHETLEGRQAGGIESVVVAWNGRPTTVALRLPCDGTRDVARVTIEREDGGRQTLDVRLDTLTERKPDRAEPAGSRGFVRELPLPGRLPYGCHRVVVDVADGRFESMLLSAPRRAWEPAVAGKTSSAPNAKPASARRWGVFLPLYSVRSGDNWGAGDYSDLGRLAEWTSRHGGSIVATLPLLPAPLDDPYDPSPYSPVTRLAWNEFYIDVTAIDELARCEAARELVSSQTVRDEIETLRRSDLVEYRRLMALKRGVLETLAEWYFFQQPGGCGDFQRFLQQHPHIVDYAEFRAVSEKRRAPWTAWPDRLRDGNLQPGDFDEAARRYYLYAQWVAHRQVERIRTAASALGTELYLDLPLGVREDGFDVWRHRDCYAETVTAGAPPDAVFTKGQDWSFSPLDPQGIRRDGYRHVRQFLGHHLRHTGMLRIDHVMSLHRLYWIPRGMPAACGVYVGYPADELYAVLSLESHRHQAMIIGENLGTVPAAVNRAMSRHGIRQMHVVQYECESGENGAPGRPPSTSVASLNTHDMPPFAAWWRGEDIPVREDLGLLDAAGAHVERQARERQKAALIADLRRAGRLPQSGRGPSAQGPGPEAGAATVANSVAGPTCDEAAVTRACLEDLASSTAEVVLVSLEDLWQETRPQNIPGTGQELPNWQRKSRHTLEEFDSLTQVVETLEAANCLRTADR